MLYLSPEIACRRMQEAAEKAEPSASETRTAPKTASSSSHTPTPGPSTLHTPTQIPIPGPSSNLDPNPGPSASHDPTQAPTPGPSSIQNPAPLTVGRAMLASKEAAAEAAAKGLPTCSGPDPADGPSRYCCYVLQLQAWTA